MTVHRCEENAKLSRLQREKPYVYEKMQRFDAMAKAGKSIAIVRIEYRYDCNFNCEHCCISDFRNTTGRMLTVEDVADISRQADEMGLARFVITGGEPLVFPELYDIIRAIDPSKHYINLDTNGYNLDHWTVRHLKRMGVDRIQLSIDSLHPEEHDSFRRKPGSWQRAMDVVEHCRQADMDMFVQTTVTRSRLYSDEFVRFIEHFNHKGVGVFVTFIKPAGNWKGKGDLITTEDIRWFENTLEKKHNVFSHMTPQYGRPGRCIAYTGMCSITPFGDVNPCPYLFTSAGNIFNEPLRDILDRACNSKPWDKIIATCPAADCEWKW